MAVNQSELAVVAALSAARKDPGVGRIRIKRGLYADVQQTAAGRVLVVERGEQRVVLIRRSAAPEAGADYPDQLPFVPNATVWWTLSGPAAATWVGIDAPDEVAAGLTAHFVREGWSAESALLMPWANMTILKRDGSTRIIMWGRRQALFYDSAGRVEDSELPPLS